MCIVNSCFHRVNALFLRDTEYRRYIVACMKRKFSVSDLLDVSGCYFRFFHLFLCIFLKRERRKQYRTKTGCGKLFSTPGIIVNR